MGRIVLWVILWLALLAATLAPLSVKAAVSGSNLTTNGDITDLSSYTTASITPGSNRLVIAAVSSIGPANVSPVEPTLSGNGLTWVNIGTTLFVNSGSTRRRVTFFRAMGASPSSGSVTIDFGGETQRNCRWSISEFTGVDTGGTNGSAAVLQPTIGDTAQAAATSLTITLGAFSDAGNGTYGGFSHASGEAITNGSGFTELGESFSASLSIQSQWRTDNDTSVDGSWTSSVPAGGLAFEIKAPSAAAAADFFPRRIQRGGP